MARPFLLAQLSDCHLGARQEAGIDPTASLETVLNALGRLPAPIDGVVVSGDLADHGSPDEYRLARDLLARLGVPVYVLPGNHDDRATMREVFAIPGELAAPIDYAVDLGPLGLVVVDSTIPDEDHGGFEPEQLERLDAALATMGDKPTIVAMHQPPLATAIADWDRVNLSASERVPLAEVIARHPHVAAIVGGHLHRAAASALAGRPVISAPSTYLQARPDFISEEVEMYGGAPGFALHALLDGELSSQFETVI